MTVSLSIAGIHSIVGSEELLHSFFSTISFHLEPAGWGTRFPELLNELYQGSLEPAHAGKALADALAIKRELSAFPLEKVVWDIANVAKKPPWGDQVEGSATSLSNYHVTSTKRVLMDLLIECLEFQVETGKPLAIRAMGRGLMPS